MSDRRSGFLPNYAVAPGGTISDTLDALGLTQIGVARRAGLTAEAMDRVIKGQAPVTPASRSRPRRDDGSACPLLGEVRGLLPGLASQDRPVDHDGVRRSLDVGLSSYTVVPNGAAGARDACRTLL